MPLERSGSFGPGSDSRVVIEAMILAEPFKAGGRSLNDLSVASQKRVRTSRTSYFAPKNTA
jgi:hypothetical protein